MPKYIPHTGKPSSTRRFLRARSTHSTDNFRWTPNSQHCTVPCIHLSLLLYRCDGISNDKRLDVWLAPICDWYESRTMVSTLSSSLSARCSCHALSWKACFMQEPALWLRLWLTLSYPGHQRQLPSDTIGLAIKACFHTIASIISHGKEGRNHEDFVDASPTTRVSLTTNKKLDRPCHLRFEYGTQIFFSWRVYFHLKQSFWKLRAVSINYRSNLMYSYFRYLPT